MTERQANRSARKPKRRAASKRTSGKTASNRRWSKHVMETSDALDLEEGIFKQRSPAAIASALKDSAERSNRRKAGPFQSAMSMLNFFINRGGKNLKPAQKARLEKAKGELRILFGRDP